MKKNKEFGFTLVELLVVIVIMGIIVTLALPALNGLVDSTNESKYKYHIEVLDAALDLYTIKNKTLFANSKTCYNLPYEDIVASKLIKEDDVICTGTVQMNRISSSSDFTYEYFLTCTNKSGKTIKTSDTIIKTCYQL